MALEMLLFGQGHPAKSHVLSFTSREIRNEEIWGAPYPALAPPAPTPGLLLFTEEELQIQSSYHTF